MRNYFLVKAELSENLADALYSMVGLKLATNHAPFLTVDSLSNAHGSAQVTDYLGNHIKFRHDLTKLQMQYRALHTHNIELEAQNSELIKSLSDMESRLS